MHAVKLDLDRETFERLVERAAAERRPIPWQAEVTLRRALGLPFPYGDSPSGPTTGSELVTAGGPNAAA